MKHMKHIFVILLSLLVFSVQAQKTVVGAAKKNGNTKNKTIKADTNSNSNMLKREKSPVENPDGSYPVITFKELSYDFGNINEGDKVEHTFEFTNTGNAPLIIDKIKASCGCTVPSNWKKAPILPGEKSSFVVKFNSKNKPNHQTKRIRITSNTKNSNEYVTIRATVKPDPVLQKAREERMAKWKKEREARKAKADAEAKAKKAKTETDADAKARKEAKIKADTKKPAIKK